MAYILTERELTRLAAHRARQPADQQPSWSDLAAIAQELGIEAVLALQGAELCDVTAGAADRLSTRAYVRGNRR